MKVNKIEETPFTINTSDEKPGEAFVAIGNDRVTEWMTERQAIRMVKNKEWNLIVQLIGYINEYNKKK